MKDRGGTAHRESGGIEFLGVGASEVALALALAVAVPVVLEKSRLRWTWVCAGLPICAVSWAVQAGTGRASVAGLAMAGAIASAWERQQLHDGGSRAQLVRERLGFFSALWSVSRRRLAERHRVRAGRFVIGESLERKLITVPLGVGEGKRGALVGAPGTGKTVDLAALAGAHVEAGCWVVCVDPKGDRSLEDALRRLARDHGRSFVMWHPTGEVAYNPLARGGPTEIADKLLAGEEWTEPHYLRQAQRYLGVVLDAMRAAGEWPTTLTQLVRHFDVELADLLGDRAGGDTAERMRAYVDSLSQRTRHELGGVRDRIAVLAESELGLRLEPGEDRDEIAFEALMLEKQVVYFRLDSDRYPLAAQMLGAAIVSDLVNLSGQLQGGGERGVVIVDEFAAVAADHISRLLSRSRSAGLSVVLAAQTFADLDLARPGDSSESLRRQVLANVDYVIAHRQSEPEAAEILASTAGTRAGWATTRQVHSALAAPLMRFGAVRGTRTPEREFVRHPDEFKRLGVGEAIVIEPASGGPATRTRIWPWRFGDG